MKKFLCAMLVCALCATASVGLSGCGCSNKSTEPGYRVTATEPDLKSGDFGFFILNKNELMLTEYTGKNKNVDIPDSYENYKVTVIGTSVFHNNREIESVTIPDSIKEIQDYAFASCKNLKNVKMSKNIEILGTNSFYYCSSLESFEFLPTLKQIDVYAFSASGLKSIEIPESETLTKIDEFTFFQCQQLSEVTLPSTITEIAERAFDDCPNKITINAPANSYALKYAKTLAKKDSKKFAVNEIK